MSSEIILTITEGMGQGEGVQKESVKLKWNLQRGDSRGGGLNQKPSTGGVWIFSGTTHHQKMYNVYFTFSHST